MAYFRCGGGADTSIVTALASDVLSPKVIVDADGNPLTGTMPNNGAVSPSALNCGGSYTIPKGYHNGSGKVTANSLASQTSADATAENILSGKTAWVNGSKVTGNMANREAVSQTLNAGGSYTIPAGYHNGSGKVTAKTLSAQGASAIKTGSFTPTKDSTTYPTAIKTICTITGVSSVPKYFMAYITNNLLGYGTTDVGIYCYTSANGTRISHFVLKFSGNYAYAGVWSTGSPLGGGYNSLNDYYLQAYYNSTNKTLTLTLQYGSGLNTNFKSAVYADTWNYIIVY